MPTLIEQIDKLTTKLFNNDGSWVSYPPSKYYQRKAKALIKESMSIDLGIDEKGYDRHASLLIVAYPDREI